MSENQTKSLTISYVMVKIGDREKLIPTIEQLYLNDHVIYCDAVDGDYDLVLLIQGASPAEVDHFIREHIKNLNGVQMIDSCLVNTPPDELLQKGAVDSGEASAPGRYDGSMAQSYLLVEADKNHHNDIVRSLQSLDSVTACDSTTGKFSLIILLNAPGFDVIRKIIAEKIRPLPGILRVKQSRIIKMFEM